MALDFLRAADLINAVKTPVLAIDLPSGIDPDTGRAAHGAVKAELTVTMAAPKPGLYLYPGASFAGKVKVAEIGHPLGLLAAQAGKESW
jgi:NAD(P)H-hydrate epimerase